MDLDLDYLPPAVGSLFIVVNGEPRERERIRAVVNGEREYSMCVRE